jgi:hypothetical protein
MISAKNLRLLALAIVLLLVRVPDSPAQRKHYPRLSLDFAIGYAFFSPNQLNNFLAEEEREKIENGPGFRGGLRVEVSRHIDFNFKIGYARGVSKGNFLVSDNIGPIANVEDEYQARTIPVSIGIGGRIPLRDLRLRAEFNVEHHIARVEYKNSAIQLDEFQTTAKSNGLGFSFAAGPEWRPLALLALNVKAGYRAAKISGFLSGSANPELVFFPIEFEVDFSGVFFEAGVQIHP